MYQPIAQILLSLSSMALASSSSGTSNHWTTKIPSWHHHPSAYLFAQVGRTRNIGWATVLGIVGEGVIFWFLENFELGK